MLDFRQQLVHSAAGLAVVAVADRVAVQLLLLLAQLLPHAELLALQLLMAMTQVAVAQLLLL